MDSVVANEVARVALALLEDAVDKLLDLPLDECTDGDVLAIWQRIGTGNRRLAAVDHRLISQAQTRHLDFVHGYPSVIRLAQQVLRIPGREASNRVRAAEAAGPRVALTGEALLPVFESVAAAQACGTISAVHARMIVKTIEGLSAAVQATDGAAAEQLLTEQAQIFDPDTFAKVAQRLTATLDPDGREPDYEKQQTRRAVWLTDRLDGSANLAGELTPELAEHLKVAFDILAKPIPGDDGARDIRSLAQRRHDALLELIHTAQRAELLPTTAGVTTTLVLTCDAKDWKAATGTTRTGHGLVVPTAEAKRWVCGDTRVIGVAIDRMKAVAAYSDCRRTFTENQRLAMTVRDQGCVFPGCDAPPARCQAHHIDEHANGGPTSINNGCLLCAFHHRMFEQMGWQVTMLDGIPHLIPPARTDPERIPRRNTAHDLAAELLGV